MKILVYLGVGALLHWLILGPAFSVYSLASWGILFGWGFVASVICTLVAIAFFIVLALVVIVIDKIEDWSWRRWANR